MALSIKIAVLLVIKLCTFVEKYQHYERICCFHFQNKEVLGSKAIGRNFIRNGEIMLYRVTQKNGNF